MGEIEREGKTMQAAAGDDGSQETSIGEGMRVIREGAGLAVLVGAFVPAPVLVALGSISLVASLVGKKKAGRHLAAMNEAANLRFLELKGRFDELEERLEGPQAAEALNAGWQAAVTAASDDKAQLFGRVLGATAAAATPNWNEATDFIHNLQQFTSDDLDALKTLWKMQHVRYQVTPEGLMMSIKPDDYQAFWTDVVRVARQELQISEDDWLARCQRLSGFGLALTVQPGTVLGGNGEYSYRITSKGARLLGALGYRVDPNEYPRSLYQPGGATITVNRASSP